MGAAPPGTNAKPITVGSGRRAVSRAVVRDTAGPPTPDRGDHPVAVAQVRRVHVEVAGALHLREERDGKALVEPDPAVPFT